MLPIRHFDLGLWFEPFCNAFPMLWVGFYTVLLCLPEFLPVTLGNMTYVSVVIVGILLIADGRWVGGKRKVFVGPVC